MRAVRLLSLVLVLVLAGCYHATIDTGLRPSGEVIEKDWAHGFVYGLVPPSEVDVAAECLNGVAQVETQLSFLNQLASFLTWGIYTPMQIRVLCAVGPDRAAAADETRVISLADDATRADLAIALSQAAEQSLREGQPAFVRFATE